MFKVGDIVYLKSGSPPLTVITDDGSNATVQWFNGAAPEETAFPEGALSAVDPAPVLKQAAAVADAQAAIADPLPSPAQQSLTLGT